MYHYEKFHDVLIDFCSYRTIDFRDLNEEDMEELQKCLSGLILPYLQNEDIFKPIFKDDAKAEKFLVDKLRQVFGFVIF